MYTYKDLKKGDWFSYCYWSTPGREPLLKVSSTEMYDPRTGEFYKLSDTSFIDSNGVYIECLNKVKVTVWAKA